MNWRLNHKNGTIKEEKLYKFYFLICDTKVTNGTINTSKQLKPPIHSQETNGKLRKCFLICYPKNCFLHDSKSSYKIKQMSKGHK